MDGGDATVHHLEVEGSRELKSAKEYSKFVTGARSQELFRKLSGEFKSEFTTLFTTTFLKRE